MLRADQNPAAFTEGEMGVDVLARIAERKKATPTQIALAWLVAQRPCIVPIFGTRKMERLEENLGAASVELTLSDLRDIENAAASITLPGARYAEAQQRMIDC